MGGNAQESDPIAAPVWAPRALRYGSAAVAVVAATGVRGALDLALGPTPVFITFYPTVALVALLVGGGPAVFAAGLSGALAWVLFGYGSSGPGEVISLALFVAAGALVGATAELLRRERASREGSLARQVAERTGELERANAGLRRAAEEHRHAMAALRESEWRFRNVFENAPMGIGITDAAGRFLECNPAYCRVLGRTEDELRAAEFALLIHPDDRAENLDLLRKLSAGDISSYEVENRFLHKSGEPIWVHKQVSALRDDSGRTTHLMALVTDVTERRRAGAALRESEGRLRLFIEHAPVALAMFDRDMRYLAVSRRWATDYHIGDRDVTGASHYEVFPELPEVWRAVHRRALAGEVVRAEDDRFERGDGTVQWVRWEVHPWYDAFGAIGGIVIFTEDVTDRRRAEEQLRDSEQRLRLAVRASNVGLWDWNLRTDAVVFSPEYEAQLGYTSGEFGGDYAAWESRLHPDDRAAALDCVRRALADPAHTHEIEFRMRHKGGSWRWILARGEVLRDATGAAVRMLGGHLDVTERRRAENELRASEARLKRVLEVETVGVMFWDLATGRMTDANDAFLKLMGYSRREVEAGELTWQGLTPPEYVATSEAEIKKFGATGRVGPYEKEYFRKDGTRRWLVFAGSSLGDDACVEFCVDIADRKRAEASLRASEELQRAILSSLTAHIAVVDRDGRIVAVNPAWEAFAREQGGLPERCGVGANYLDVCRSAIGPGADDAHRVAGGVRSVLDGAVPAFSLEYPCDTRTERRWFSLQATPLPSASGGAALAHMDITGRKQAEQEVREREARLTALLNTAADAIVTIDHQGTVMTVNPATEQLFGYAPDELIGQNVRVLMPPPYFGEHDGYLRRYLETGEARIIGSGREVAARRKDGSVFPVDLAVSEIDHLRQFTGIIRDATRRKELEHEVVEIASFEQRRIGQDLHDSVGQELTALNILTADLAESVPADPVASQLVTRIAAGLQRCQRELRVVIRGLLPVAVDAEGLMAALDDLAERTTADGKVACTFECPRPVAVSDNLTATHLYLIAQEAVHNAIKHGRPRTVRIRLTAPLNLVLRVEDDGTGLPAAPAAPPDRPGLGLRIMRNRASIIGARLTIEPAAPQGTAVTCELIGRSHD